MSNHVFPQPLKYPFDHRGLTTMPPETLHGGLTKRELFAAMVMQGLLASNPQIPAAAGQPQVIIQAFADSAALFADALIKKLAEEKS